VTEVRDIKRSLTIAGHRTSVSLEAPFWDELKDIAKHERRSLAALVGEIDAARGTGGASLSSAIRCFVLMRLKARIEPPRGL
jgi:predicted DNA-binding ribbon-helix-helix protein